MKKLILIVSVFLSSLVYSQESSYTDIPFEMYGVWQSIDGEFVKIYSDITGGSYFQRVRGRTLLASGEIKRVGDELHIIRSDKKDEYNLLFVIGNGNMVITKPNSDQAWLWQRVGQ